MTGLDFIEDAKVRLGESQSTSAQQQSMLYPRHVRWAADKLARDTWALYRNAVTDIIDGQVEYSIPSRPFRLMAVCVNDGSGNIRPLDAITPETVDIQYGNWRTSNPTSTYQGVPEFYLPEGLLEYKLFPTPNYSVQDGLLVGGYYGVDKWWNMADDSPLPEAYDEAIVMGTAWRRCVEMQRVDPTYASLIAQYKSEFESLKRDLYRESLGANAARRSGAVPAGGGRLGSFGAGWGWWG